MHCDFCAESIGDDWAAVDGLEGPSFENRIKFCQHYAHWMILVKPRKCIEELMCGLNYCGVSNDIDYFSLI